MTRLSRRTWLASGLVLGASGLVPRWARAAPFGTFPAPQASVRLPESLRVKNVLEVYLYGGLSPWETLYFVEGRGDGLGLFWDTYENITDGTDSNALALSLCGSEDTAPSFFARDSDGVDVHLGPFSFGLRERADLFDRMRLVVQAHNLLPHEAAVPLALTGKAVGQPSLAGLGAHIQRHFVEADAAAGLTTRRSPYSYVLASGGALPSDNTAAFVATGTHPGFSRPLRINVDAVARLSSLMAREGLVGSERHDALIAAAVDRYRQRLRHRGQGEPLRSPRFQELAESARAQANTAAVKDLLAPALRDADLLDLCGSTPVPNLPGLELSLAAHLLTHPEEPARYVCVVDTGLTTASGGGGYDTHTENAVVTARNFNNLLRSLAGIINAPGEATPGKLNLDDTLVILNTEFGRTPGLQEGAGGRNHHPYGYVTAFLGGPLRRRGIAGAIDEAGLATTSFTAAENRMAALLALGIHPFSGDSFFQSDVPGTAEEAEGIVKVTEQLLDVEVDA